VQALMIGNHTEEVVPQGDLGTGRAPLRARSPAKPSRSVSARRQDGRLRTTFSPVRRDRPVVAGTMTARDASPRR
jgi:hypothetical protein